MRGALLRQDPGYVYSRYSNPTMDMFEKRMAALEGAEAARSTATGMAAVTTALMGLVKAGDHVVAAKALFGSCRWVIEEWLPRFGVASTLVNGTDLEAWRAAVRKNTKAFFMETPTNPTLEVYDIAAVAAIAHEAGAKLVVDNVFATPLYQSPLELGADVRGLFGDQAHRRPGPRASAALFSASEKLILDHYHQPLRQTGPSLSPFNAWVMLKGLETLSLRVHKQTENAAAVSNALAGHKKISRLIYPGRADHPQADVIVKQMRAGSTLCSFEVKGGKEGAFRFLNALQLIGITNNLGDAKSLVTHPTTTTHQRLTPAQRAELGIGDGLVRFSAGLEHPDDLIEDLLTALDAV